MIDAYVDGRPIPRSSSSFTRDASLYRGGGSVEFCSGIVRFSFSGSPSFSGRQRDASSPLRPRSTVSLRFLIDLQEPVELQHRSRRRGSHTRGPPAPRSSTVVWSNTAGIICDATNRCQISLYSRYCSSLRYRRISSGCSSGFVGRIASCASCASFFERYAFGFSGRYFAAQLLPDILAHRRDRIRRYPRRIGTHVGDQAHRPSGPRSTPSYSRCATPIVRLTLKPSCRDASCCSLLVVNGEPAFRRRSFRSTVRTLHRALAQRRNNRRPPSSGPATLGRAHRRHFRASAPSIATSRAINSCPSGTGATAASIVQYSTGLNA